MDNRLNITMKSQFRLPIILDGGMGRELKRIGAPFQQPEWSAQALIESPHFISEVHKSFIEAGAEVITTNTYALVPFHIGEKRFNEQGADLIKLAARLARECVKENSAVLVAGCIPPVLGSYRPDLFSVEKAKPVLELLIKNQEADVDIWLAETISSIAEAAMIKARTVVTNKPTWIAFTIKDEITTEPALRSGESVYDAVSQIAGQNVSAILFNCSGVEVMETALITAKQALLDKEIEDQVQLGVYANNFPPIGELHQANQDHGVSGIRDDVPPEKYHEFGLSWINAGASIIGGCCGVSPAHIKKLAELK
ncbi:homocysteine S-methyltransferase [Psychromonas ingrahamii 37]|uniref:Homocysteine S-methyltransferase n=1 Tax=Psychromonas ingrahamii (strain DSM 17664 / CCUG 51855 / 37) TaxID=357804 RepID=A1SWN6_PSYIN|nr:homocysteine S-methyltransferase family protein [Psychromonas ingrahamii]ABM03901.1 homocysteine S-methyltransferase [Psychromonas ingrahamii 37]